MKLARVSAFIFVVLFFAQNAAAVSAGPKFTLTPTTKTIKAGETVEISIGVATGDVKSTMYDVLLSYDASKVELTSAVLDNLAIADYDLTKTIDNTSGKFVGNIYSKTSIFEQKVFNSNLIKLTFTGKASGNTSLSFVCTSGSYNDTNILYVTNNGKDSVDKVTCSENDTATLTVSGTLNPGATPTVRTTTPTSRPSSLPNSGTTEVTVGLIIFGIVSLFGAGSILRL